MEELSDVEEIPVGLLRIRLNYTKIYAAERSVVPSWNVSPEPSYTHWDLLWFSLVSPGKFREW